MHAMSHAVSALIGAGAATIVLFAQAPTGASEVVRTRRLLLQDDAGKVRAEMHVEKDQTVGLLLYDNAGVKRMILTCGKDPMLSLNSTKGGLSLFSSVGGSNGLSMSRDWSRGPELQEYLPPTGAAQFVISEPAGKVVFRAP